MTPEEILVKIKEIGFCNFEDQKRREWRKETLNILLTFVGSKQKLAKEIGMDRANLQRMFRGVREK